MRLLKDSFSRLLDVTTAEHVMFLCGVGTRSSEHIVYLVKTKISEDIYKTRKNTKT